MSYSREETLRNIFSILAGAFIALLIIIPFGIFGAFLSFSDAKIPKSQEITSTIILIIGLTIGMLAGGYTTSRISTTRSMIYVIITAAVLMILFLWMSNFEKSFFGTTEILILISIFPLTILGGFIGNKKK